MSGVCRRHERYVPDGQVCPWCEPVATARLPTKIAGEWLGGSAPQPFFDLEAAERLLREAYAHGTVTPAERWPGISGMAFRPFAPAARVREMLPGVEVEITEWPSVSHDMRAWRVALRRGSQELSTFVTLTGMEACASRNVPDLIEERLDVGILHAIAAWRAAYPVAP